MSAEEIKRLRTSLGWSQERMARELGVSFCTVNRWERGKTVPSPMALKSIAALKGTAGKRDLRRHPRIGLRYPITVHKHSEHAPIVFTAYTDNISNGGIMFTAPHDIKLGDIIRIELHLGEHAEKSRIEALSEVVWAQPKDASKQIGVRFKEMMTEDGHTALNSILMN